MLAAFPFSAIVGQDELKEALLIAAVDRSVGGVLVFGDRGTGKSTAIRALASLLPQIAVVPDCPYNCDPAVGCPHGSCAAGAAAAKGKSKSKKIPVPVIDLPLGATEDRVVGALDIERALVDGMKVFEPGLLARAHRGFLYIDEVNLLEDHLVDLLLDVAASGENIVEREGLSVQHPAQFVLVGSGNPEEGELRPQLLDRFGLAVDVTTPQEIATRVDIVRRRDGFEKDRAAFAKKWSRKDGQLRRRILAAREGLKDIKVPDDYVAKAARICVALGSDGLRGELTLVAAGRALASLENAREAGTSHLRRVASAALCHRLRRDPLDESGSRVRVERVVDEVLNS